MIQKIVNKITRIAQNHENSTPFSAIYLMLIAKIVFRIVIFFFFLKIFDVDSTKITKMSRKIDLLDVIAEKP